MTEKVEPQWTWDEEAEAGYIDFNPDYTGRRRTKTVTVNTAFTLLADFNGDGDIVGVEVML